MPGIRAAILAVLLICCCTVVRADEAAPSAPDRVRLPLQGFFRPGRWMPVVVSRATDDVRAREIVVDPPGSALRAILDGDRSASAVAHVLILTADAAHVSLTDSTGAATARGQPLTAVRDDQLLIARIGSIRGDELAAVVPGNLGTVVVRLDHADDVHHAIGACDVLVIGPDAPAAAVANEAVVRRCLATSTVLAVAQGRPFALPELPWKHDGAWSVLPAMVTGPRSAIGGEGAFAPVAGWRPSLPSKTRRNVVLVGLLVSLLTLACLLLRSPRWSVAAVVAVLMVSLAAILMWTGRAVAVSDHVAGTVMVRHGGWRQIDDWEYLAARGRAELTLDLGDAGMPVFVDAAHALALNAVTLSQSGLNTTRLSMRLSPGARVAILTRGIDLTTAPIPGQEETGSAAIAALSRTLYSVRNAKVDSIPRDDRRALGKAVITLSP